VLFRNRTALARLSTKDRLRAEALLRGVAARWLAEPESHLERLSTANASAQRLEAVRELFGIEETGPAGFEPAT
jgi:hypothetical protein